MTYSKKILIDFNQAAYFGSSLLEALRIIWTKIEHRDGRQSRQNRRVNSTSTVMSSRRPSSIAAESTHLAPSGSGA